MRIIKYFALLEESDIGGPKREIAAFEKEYDAKLANGDGKGKRDNWKSIEEKSLMLFSSYVEYQDFESGDLKKKALAKLSLEEIVALGIKI